MKYRELVARIAEVTRTLVAVGGNGEFDPDSCKFRTPGSLPESVKSGFLLRIKDGPMTGLYTITDATPALGTIRLATDAFMAQTGPMGWEIYDPGVSEEDVRRVLTAFPDVIMECKEGDYVRTTLGMFRLTRRKRKRVKDPQGKWTFSEEKIVARIRPGKRLQREISGPSGPSILPPPEADPDSDEDP